MTPDLLYVAPAVLGFILYAIKRLAGFDLELRAHRERLRVQYLEAAREAREAGRVPAAEARHAVLAARHAVLKAQQAALDARPTVQGARHGLVALPRTLGAILDAVQSTVGEIVRTLPSTLGEVLRSLWEIVCTLPSILWETGRAVGTEGVRTLASLESLLPWRRTGTRLGVRTDIPRWALALLGDDGERYAREWAAHLHERVEDGEIREARRDRRRLVRRAPAIALSTRLRAIRRLRRNSG